MTNKSTLLALAERVEKAEGADRELDCRIYAEMQGWRFIKVMHRQKEGHFYAFRTSDGDKTVLLAPFYTRSLDTAMTLVPDGWNFANLSQSDKGGWWCELRRGHHTSYDATAFGGQLENHSAAIAVCAAALRAHASQK